MRRIAGKLIKWILILILLAAIAVLGLNVYMCVRESRSKTVSITSNTQTLTSAQKQKFKDLNLQCIIVLGAGIKNTIEPSDMLKDRLDAAVRLYKAGVAPKILLTGDNGTVQHNEIHVMLMYMRKAGVPDNVLFCDHAGFSTYDSMYRAKSIFQVKRAVVVTQTYHLYRSMYIADQLGIKVQGAASDQDSYSGQAYREFREIIARVKDMGKVYMHAKSTLGGSKIPITGSGVSSHGE